MNKLKTCKILQSLDARFYEICDGVDTYVENILKWANELENIVEKEFSSKNADFTFQLPKTPSERKLRNRAKRTLVSKGSASNSTLTSNDINNSDTTISTRTRAGRKVLTSKMSQLNITVMDKPGPIIDVKAEPKEIDKNKTNPSNNTFVLSNATSTRTKPVHGKRTLKTEAIDNTSEDIVNPIELIHCNEKADGQSKKRNKEMDLSLQKNETPPKVSQNNTKTPTKRESKNSFSRPLSHSPLRRNSRPNSNLTGDANSAENHAESMKLIDGLARRKSSRALSESPISRPSKYSRTFSGKVSDHNKNKSPNSTSQNIGLVSSTFRISSTHVGSPVLRSSKIFTSIASPITNEKNVSSTLNAGIKAESGKEYLYENPAEYMEADTIPGIEISAVEPPQKETATFIIETERAGKSHIDFHEEKTPKISEGKMSKIRKTSTPVSDKGKPFTIDDDKFDGVGKYGDNAAVTSEEASDSSEICFNSSHSAPSANEDSNKAAHEEVEPREKTKKIKAEKISSEYLDKMDSVRITRTKSKALKEKMMDANLNAKDQQDLSEFAKRLLMKAKQSSQKKNQLAALAESNATPKNGAPFYIFPAGVVASKSKYHLLLSSSKKQKTPLATLPNSSVKKPQTVNKLDSSSENIARTAAGKKNAENKLKMKANKKKEDEAAKKRQKVIQNKQAELKRKNELKHQLAMKQREKLEQEKYLQMIQLEKEKEERHKIILQERQMKLKEEALKKKMMTQQKIAETVERRRIEEEARIAKLKEMEAEEQRIALEKQKEQERQEKREQERLAMKKAREEYEMQMKREAEAQKIKAERLAAAATASATKKGTDFLSSTSKMQSACKKQRFGLMGDKKEWDYKPRHENDLGLEDEHSEVESDEEKDYKTGRQPPPWAESVKSLKSPILNSITLEMLCEYMYCPQKTPDIHKMFNMTPTKRIKRTSSAIWNTPTS